MSKRNIIITCIVITIAIFLIFIYYIGKAYRKDEIKLDMSNETIERNQIKNNEILIETSSNEDTKVSPTAVLRMVQFYEDCGHIVKEEYNVPEAIVNMTENEIKEYYSGWEIRAFSEDMIEIYKENEGICDEHYTVKDINGYITVYIKNNNGEEKVIRKTEILTKYLSEEDQTILKNGVNVVGKKDLESLLEDFE